MTEKKIRVLVVDDSALMRKRLSEFINSDPECEVIGTARNGEEAIRGVAALKPDVVTLDLELPKIDGVTVLKYVMSEWPTPIIVVTGFTQFCGEDTLKCLEYGAVDVVAKPSGVISLDIGNVQNELLEKVKAAARVDMGALKPRMVEYKPRKKDAKGKSARGIVAIASSTGGPRALSQVLPKLAPDIQAGILVVQHMPVGFTRSLAQRLDCESSIHVKEAQDGEPIKAGEALIAPGGLHMTVKATGAGEEVVVLSHGPKTHGLCPSADVMMESVAPLYRERSVGVVLTGMGSDGTNGLRAIKMHGGRTVAEDKSTAIIYGMPKSACEAGVVDCAVPLPLVAGQITQWVDGEAR